MTDQVDRIDQIVTLHGRRALVCAPDGPAVRGYREAVDLVGETYGQDVALVVLPVERLDPRFFTLATGVAGEIVQKFAQYGLQLVIRGDVSAHMERSAAFRAFVQESDRGRQLWFVADDAELDERLAGQPAAG